MTLPLTSCQLCASANKSPPDKWWLPECIQVTGTTTDETYSKGREARFAWCRCDILGMNLAGIGADLPGRYLPGCDYT